MASSSSSVSWTPAPGRHTVNIGPSLGKALKARKLKASPSATGTTKRSNLPERDFYSFRFNFKPPSIDAAKPASIDIQKSSDNTKVLAEYPSAQSGEAHIFRGAEQPAKEIDCVLIFDEDTGTYSLEKLDSLVNLRYDRKTTVSPRPSPAPSTQRIAKGKGKQPQVMRELEQLLGLDEDAGGGRMQGVAPKPIACKEEEEEEEEIFRPATQPSLVPPKTQPVPPPKARPVKPIPKPRVEAKAPVTVPQPPRQKITPPPPPSPATSSTLPTATIPPVSAPPRAKPRAVKKEQAQQKESIQQKEPVQQKGPIPKKGSVQKTESTPKTEPIQKKEPIQKEKKAKPRPVPTSKAPPKYDPYADEEVFEFSRPAKRARPSTPQQPIVPPTPPTTVTLSLPGGSNAFAPPPAPSGSHNSRGGGSSSRNVPPPTVPPPTVSAALSLSTSTPASPPMMGQYESDEEEDWDEVSTANLASASLAPSNSNADDNAVAYERSLEEEIFRDVFEEVDGDYEGQQSLVDGDGEEEEIDVNAFEQELNAHMEVGEVEDSDDDIFGGLAVELEPESQGTRQPISLNRLASGGGAAEMSDEEYSSSDDSDDD